MSTVHAVRCKGCGGTVAMTPGQTLPSCLFCGSDAAQLQPYDAEDVEPPEGFLPFEVDETAADSAFREFCSGSFWYPGDLRNSTLSLRPLLLPAWAWSGRLETHWAGLVSAHSPSGKRPVSGVDDCEFSQILIPASTSLRLQELSALGAYDESGLTFSGLDDLPSPHEISQMTRSAAQAQAEQEMERRHAQSLRSSVGAVELNTSCVSLELSGRPVLLPVWIGAFRYGDRTYRILVNGQSAVLYGKAPISWWRIAGAALAVVGGLGLVLLMLSVCAGGVAAAP